MNDQSQMMNQAQMMSQPHIMSQPQMMSQMPQSSQPQLMSQTQAMAAQPQQPQLMMMSNQSQPLMMSRGGGYKAWPQQPSMDPSKKFQNSSKPNFVARNNNWKGKKGTDKRQDPRRLENLVPNASMSGQTSSGGGGGGYKPPTLHELQSQNRLKARKFYHPKKKFNNRFAPYAPRNTTSFIIRAKKSGGIASLVSPCPVTPAVLPTPIFSPSREVLGDMAKEEWGVDGYGSMKGLIRLRSPGNDEEDDEEGGGGSSESDVEEHVEVERRLDHDLSRFEMIYPNYSGTDYNNVLENRVDDQDTHIAQLEEENLTLKERLFLMERDLGDLRRRLQFLERQNDFVREVREEVVENESENESEGGSGAPDMCLSGKNNDGVVVEYTSGQEGSRDVEGDSKKDHDDGAPEIERAGDVSMEDFGHGEVIVREKNDVKDEEAKKHNDMTVDKDEKAKTDEVADEVLAREAKPTLVEREVNAEKKDEVDITFSEKSIGDGD